MILFVVLLITMHVSISPAERSAAYAIAEEGRGGGRLGAALMLMLNSGLGMVGLVVVLVAGFIIGLALTLDMPVIDLFAWLPPLILRIEDAWDERRAARHERQTRTAPTSEVEPFVPQTSPQPEVPQMTGQPSPNPTHGTA